jgi:hypothetical protein
VEALRQALAAEVIADAVERCMEAYAQAMDAAWRVADAAGLAGSDRLAYLTRMTTWARARVLERGVQRRDEQVTFASRQLVAWRRRGTGARARSTHPNVCTSARTDEGATVAFAAPGVFGIEGECANATLRHILWPVTGL